MSNFVHLIGNVGNIKLPESDNQPLKMSLATTNVYKKDGKTIKDTDWHNLIIFSLKMKELYQKHIGKGSQISVYGSLRSSKTENNGKTYYNYNVHVDRIEFLNLKKPA